MTQEQASSLPVAETTLRPSRRGMVKTQISVEEIVESFTVVRDDIEQISRLTSEEKNVAAQCLKTLVKYIKPLPSIEVSTSIIPIRMGVVTQAHIDSTAHLVLTFSDGHQELKDLNIPENTALMITVIDDVMPKVESLIREKLEAERLRKAAQVKQPPKVEIPIPAPTPKPAPKVEAPPPVKAPEPTPQPLPTPEPEPTIEQPDPLAERNSQIDAIMAETLNYLEILGGEVFEHSPVSKYFDDWMVNLRQVILSFESNAAIGPEEAFSKEYNQIFGTIEDELSKILGNEAEAEVSLRTLVENRYILNKIDEGYVAESKQLVTKDTSTIEQLMRNLQNLEKELSEVEQIKTSFRHPLQKMAKDQKLAELTQKITATKKRLAVAVGTSSVEPEKSGDLDAEFAAHSRELEEKRKVAMEFLSQNVKDLEAQLEELKQNKTSNPFKKVGIQQQAFEVSEKLDEAKKRVALAEQNSSDEMKKLREEYEQKKQAALGKMQSLEKDIATKTVDNSAGVRKETANALMAAVKGYAQRKATEPLKSAEDASLQT